MADQPNSLLWWNDWVDEKRAVCLEFSKTFDTTSHNILIIKLRKWGLGKWGTVKWIESWLNGRSQRVKISSTGCSWRPAASGVPQEYWVQSSTWVISDADEEAELTLSKFTDDKKLGQSGWYTWRLCCHPARPGQVAEMGGEKHNEVQQRQV